MTYELTSAQKELMRVLNCFMNNQSCALAEDFSAFHELYNLAAIHRVSAVVFETIRQDKKVLTSDFFSQWKRSAIREVSLQAQRTQQFLSLYQKMREIGICPIVVKGIIRRETYEKSDFCTSSDEDLLLSKKDFHKCDQFLLEQGFIRQEIDINNLPQELSYYQPQTFVYLEIHLALFPTHLGVYGDLNEDFMDAFESAIIEKVQGVPILTLEPTLHMWYLICHSLKHFLHSGFGVRQICDMVKMTEYYQDQINWAWIHKRIHELKLERYWGGICDIVSHFFYVELGEKYDGSLLLKDLFESGIYGGSSLARRQSANMTLTAAKRGKKDTFASLWNSLFPGKEYMCSKYKYLKEHPWMWPKAWLCRLGGYLCVQRKSTGTIAGSGQNGANEKGSINIGMQRVKLLEKYGLIGE